MIVKWFEIDGKTYVTLDKEDGKGIRVMWLPYIDNVPVTQELRGLLDIGPEEKVMNASS